MSACPKQRHGKSTRRSLRGGEGRVGIRDEETAQRGRAPAWARASTAALMQAGSRPPSATSTCTNTSTCEPTHGTPSTFLHAAVHPMNTHPACLPVSFPGTSAGRHVSSPLELLTCCPQAGAPKKRRIALLSASHTRNMQLIMFGRNENARSVLSHQRSCPSPRYTERHQDGLSVCDRSRLAAPAAGLAGGRMPGCAAPVPAALPAPGRPACRE